MWPGPAQSEPGTLGVHVWSQALASQAVMCPLRLAGLAAPPPRRGTPSGTPSGTPLWSGAHLASAGPRSSAGAPVPAPCRLGVPRPSGRLRNALPSGVAHTHCPGEDGSPSPTITELLERPHGVSHIRSAVELTECSAPFPAFPLGGLLALLSPFQGAGLTVQQDGTFSQPIFERRHLSPSTSSFA